MRTPIAVSGTKAMHMTMREVCELLTMCSSAAIRRGIGQISFGVCDEAVEILGQAGAVVKTDGGITHACLRIGDVQIVAQRAVL